MKKPILALGFCLIAVVVPASVDDSGLDLVCVSRTNIDRYVAADGTVVVTDICTYDPDCENAKVTFGRPSRITWASGRWCRVVKVEMPPPVHESSSVSEVGLHLTAARR